jgi:hypothetical protein
MNKRDGWGLGLALLVASCGASAQGFAPLRMSDPGETCYTWEGGHKSAGSFSKCSPSVVIAAAPLPPPVVQSPVMMPMSAPVVQQTCAPAPKKPIIRKKPRPAPKKC